MNPAFILTSILLLMHPSSGANEQGAHHLLPEQFSSAAAHQDGEEQFVVQAAAAMPAPCIAVASDDKDVAILISRALLEKLAASARKDGYTDEKERLEMILARRARALLGSADGVPAAGGCQQARMNGETQYLIARLLNSGQAAILETRTNRLYPSFTVRISTRKGLGGMAAYRVEDGPSSFRTFFACQTWVR